MTEFTSQKCAQRRKHPRDDATEDVPEAVQERTRPRDEASRRPANEPVHQVTISKERVLVTMHQEKLGEARAEVIARLEEWLLTKLSAKWQRDQTIPREIKSAMRHP